MARMIPDHHITVPQAAEYLAVSDRRVRDLIASGETVGGRVGQRQWAADAASVVSSGAARAHSSRRLSPESQRTLIRLLGNGLTDWITALVAHWTRKRIGEWTPCRRR